jgi:phenylalanyl-tRNA synthetase beta chain
MGGEHSGCDENTTDVLIESALWDPMNIAATGRKLGINSDARYRFERGVDPGLRRARALELATQLVLESAAASRRSCASSASTRSRRCRCRAADAVPSRC